MYDDHVFKICRDEIVAAGRALPPRVPNCSGVHNGMTSAEGVSNQPMSTTGCL